MLVCDNLELSFKDRVLFKNVNIKFESDNCYGVIGANGAGKSTFLKILNGDIEPTRGSIIKDKGERISYLVQDHSIFDDKQVLEIVIAGDSELYNIKKEKDSLYMKEDFKDEDGIRVGVLEDLFLKKNGWQAESDAAILLSGLGISQNKHNLYMKDLKEIDKVKVLLARSLFGNPDILLLDEPTNGLDLEAKDWLENFLLEFKNTVIVISHDRDFLNRVCTHMIDIDYEKITKFVGNYDFWYESSELIKKQIKESNKKKEQKIQELENFIRRFQANASKSKQATSRKKALEKIQLDELKPSNRKYPYIKFTPYRPLGKDVIKINKLNLLGKETIVHNFKLTINSNDKIVVIGNELLKTALLEAIYNNNQNIMYGQTVKISYLPKSNNKYFTKDENMIQWLSKYSSDTSETFIRSILGKMLFSGEEALKSVNVLSGGEKVRCMLAKIMLEQANVLLLDEPTNHLDMESIQALNNALIEFPGVVVFTTYDVKLISTVSNRIIKINDDGTFIDSKTSYDSYLRKYESK